MFAQITAKSQIISLGQILKRQRGRLYRRGKKETNLLFAEREGPAEKRERIK